jgi:ligand-binding sensor protein
MDYTSLYNTFINYFKSVDIVQRIKIRNSNDFRLNDTENIYTEKHHIIPRHDT